MRIDEIEIIPNQNFSQTTLQNYLNLTSCVHTGDMFSYDNRLHVNYINNGKEFLLILSDEYEKAVAYAGFEIISDKILQAKNVAVFSPYTGENLAAKMYKFVKEQMHKSIQSDNRQTISGKKLWLDGLEKEGLNPCVYDTMTHDIIDRNVYPEKFNELINVMYDSSDERSRNYIWVMEKNDNYPSQNILTETKLLLSIKTWWRCEF